MTTLKGEETVAVPPDAGGKPSETAADGSDSKIRVTRKSAAYWVVTIANPPFNVVGPAEVLELQAVVDQLEPIRGCRSWCSTVPCRTISSHTTTS